MRLLGPVEAYANGRPVQLGPRKQRFVLAVLALEVNQLVPVDRLVELMWPESPPRTATHAVQVCVSRLRSILAGAASPGPPISRTELVGRGGGYLLQADPMAIDAHRFRALAEQARGVATDVDRMDLLGAALALWVGPALAGCAPAELSQRLCRGLEESRLVAVEDRLDARLRLGQHREVLDELTGLVCEHPARERLVGQLMLALYRAGRPSDALAVFRDAQRRLAEDAGLDPGVELRQLELLILRNDPSLDLPSRPDGPAPSAGAGTGTAQGAAVCPGLLPPAVAGFAGRPTHLARLTEVLAEHEASVSAPSIVVISGTAGVGKTALAVHWAHLVAHRFPDGQLHVNLRGFDPTGTALPSGAAIQGFLTALGVRPPATSVDVPALVSLYRSRLTGTRTLIVLDNAADAEQVRPLLPGAPGCLVLVTSRTELTSLVAVEGARPMALDVLATGEARQLLRWRLGPERVAAEPDAVDDLIGVCARLPLALAIVAARAAMRPGAPLSRVVAEIRRTPDGLDPFYGGDELSDVRALFFWSYRTLSAGAARLFRLLALRPGPDIAAHAAASLTGADDAQTGRELAELTSAHLLDEHLPGRYSCHDLLRSYATELAAAIDGPAQLHAARRRLYDHYLHTAHAAAELLDACRDAIVVPHSTIRVEVLADHDHALDWLIEQYAALLGAVAQAGQFGFDAQAWQLGCTLVEFFERRGLWQDWSTALDIALRSAERLGDGRALAYSHRGLGRANEWLGHHDDADAHHRRALEYFTGVGDCLGQARTWHSLGRLAEVRGRLDEALSFTQTGLELFRAAGNRPGIAKALNGVGWYHCLLGDHRQALRHCEEALVILQDLGDRRVEANTWDSLGYAHHRAGEHRRSIDCYEQALAIFREIGDRFHEADASIHLGDAYADLGDPDSARQSWRRALSILDELGHAEAMAARTRLGERGWTEA